MWVICDDPRGNAIPKALQTTLRSWAGSLEKVMVSGLESVMAMDSHASGKLSFND